MSERYDICILGGGLTGLVLACALGKHHFRVALIEQSDLSKIRTKGDDGRSIAIAHRAQQILDSFNLWDTIKEHISPIEQIRIADNYSPLFLHFDHQLVGKEPLGYMVENCHLYEAFLPVARSLQNISLLSPFTIEHFHQDEGFVTLHGHDGTIITTTLLIAADGKHSKLRQLAGIQIESIDYHQTALVLTVGHELPHRHIAVEHFFQSGPFAILPLKGEHRSSLVWVEKPEVAKLLLEMSTEEVLPFLSRKFGSFLGSLTVETALSSYPLRAQFAFHFFKNRLLLVGDAAHFIHPIAGQGFNLTLGDIDDLVKRLCKQYELGLDIGCPLMLEHYEQARRAEDLTMLTITDTLNRLFCASPLSVQLARKLGLAAINRFPPLQRFFMKYAMGYRT